MKENHLWNRAKAVQIQTSPDIAGGFDIGFDPRISEETKNELQHFVHWVEANFSIPVTLWVDFKYNHYLLRRNKERVGYLIYWADFTTYPKFENADDIPIIQLPVRTEHWSMKSILGSFIEAISTYFAWLTNTLTDDFVPDEDEVKEVLQAYLSACEK